tara:strand:- start:5009 stop:6595 length:1587 start_codon:yes stop_codon:yes gene_type:complete
MAHDGTNHPWYQGFTNIFGNMNQGFQNAMMPQTQNVTRQDFLADWFRQQGQIADNGFFDVQGFMSTNDAGEQIFDPVKFRDAYAAGDPNAAMAMVLGEEAFKDSKLAPKGKMNELMNNPAFMMGLNLMGQAAQGKGIQEALAPSMTATQAFMTNQELRQQNKRLSMNRDGTISEALDSAVKRKIDLKTAEAGATIATAEADSVTERIRLQFESMGLSNEAQKQANEFFEITKDGKAELVEQQVTKGFQDIDKGNIEIKVAEATYAALPQMQKLQMENLALTNEGLSNDLKMDVIDMKVAEINMMNQKDAREINQDWFDTVDAMDATNAEKNAMKRGGPDRWFAMVDEKELLRVESDYEANHKSTISKSKMFKFFTNREDQENIEELLHEQIKSQAIKLAAANDRKTPIRSDYLEAEKLVYSNNNIHENSSMWQWLGGSKFQIGVLNTVQRAKGGPVQAGKPYIVGEEGPEVMVPNQSGNIVSNPATKGGYNWEDAIIDNSEMLKKIKQTNGRAEAVKALKKFRPDLYV